jgi:crotonobetainyl-CoA:carnitine CoA-transferase CaiB-like acyl-CoA transferase
LFLSVSPSEEDLPDPALVPMAPTATPLPLDGVTVVSVEQAVAAPFATRHLADLGARVIKVERPGTGDFARAYDTTVHGLASHFVWLNRGKESVELDLKDACGRDALAALVARADVFVQNLVPGAIGRLGFGAERLRAEHPRLITVAVSGYGEDGPDRDRKAYDLLVQCEAGLVAITGTEETPSKAGISIADIAAGMYAYSGILAALLERERTGRGSTIEVSLLEALGEWMSYPAYYAGYGGTEPARAGASHATIVPYGPVAAAGGRQVNLAIQNDREWRRFCAVVLRRPEVADDPRFVTNSDRVANRADLEAIIGAETGMLTVDELTARLDEAAIAYGRQHTVHEFIDHPQLRARGRWREIGSPAGPLLALRPPVTVADQEPSMGAVPALGEHTEAVLRWAGLDEAAIAALRVAR